jgi:hypothetical protein
MKNNELLKKYAGISTRIRRIFAYHYDQIQREVQTEISTLTPELQAQFMDLVVEYMEESINWPDPDDQVNEEMPNYSKITCFKLYQEEFEKTPKRSIKRYLYQPAE